MKTITNDTKQNKLTTSLAVIGALAVALLASAPNRAMASQPWPAPVTVGWDETYINDWDFPFPVEVHSWGRIVYSYHADGQEGTVLYNLLSWRETYTNLENGKTVTVVYAGPVYGTGYFDFDANAWIITLTIKGTVLLINGPETTVSAGIEQELLIIQLNPFSITTTLVKQAGTANTGPDIYDAFLAAMQ